MTNSVRKVGEYSLTSFQLESVNHGIFVRTRIDLGISRVAIKFNYKTPAHFRSDAFPNAHKMLQNQVVCRYRPAETRLILYGAAGSPQRPAIPRFLGLLQVAKSSRKKTLRGSCESS